MFFIYSWNHQEDTSYGPVAEEQCQNCGNKEFWDLHKMSKFFSLFFIPIFPHHNDYWLRCPTCNEGIKLNKEEFKNYKLIAEIISAFLEKKLSEEDKTRQLKEINKIIDKAKEDKRAKIIEESKNWVKLASEKSNSQLLNIIIARKKYNPAFIIAVESEIEKRNLRNDG